MGAIAGSNLRVLTFVKHGLGSITVNVVQPNAPCAWTKLIAQEYALSLATSNTFESDPLSILTLSIC